MVIKLLAHGLANLMRAAMLLCCSARAEGWLRQSKACYSCQMLLTCSMRLGRSAAVQAVGTACTAAIGKC